MVGEHKGGRPTVVEAQAVGVHLDVPIGCHIGEPPNVYRIELECDPRTGNVVLVVKKVKKATKDGF